MTRLITYGLFPVSFVLAMGGAAVAFDAGAPAALILLTVSASTVLVIAIFERLHPHFPVWNRSQQDVPTDLTHALVSMVLLPQVLEVVLPAILLSAAIALTDLVGGGVWPSSWPMVAQLALAMLISQFGEYWAHRLGHEIPFLWRFHATHHSPKRLYWLNAARFHPVDSMIGFSAAMIPMILLGVGPKVMLLFTVWVAVHGLFQHCNIEVRLGPLNYLFSMAELHRWHHSLKLEEANANYGNNILFWDLVFGTVYWPRDRQASQEIGLSDQPDFPQDYLGQLLSPLRYRWQDGNDA